MLYVILLQICIFYYNGYGENELYDGVPARDISTPEGGDILNLVPGDECKASFGSKIYPARVVAIGNDKHLSVEM